MSPNEIIVVLTIYATFVHILAFKGFLHWISGD